VSQTISPQLPRRRCYECFKPESHCLCHDITPIDNSMGITIIQHPRERRHALGTVRLAKAGLRNIDVKVHGTRAPVNMAVPKKCALLYPSNKAVMLEDITPQEHPEHLLVLDGTWHHAKKLYQVNPWMHDLPHVCLKNSPPSRYRIRKEPSLQHLSTLEAIVYALGILTPQDHIERLLLIFDRMIDQQINSIQRNQTPRAKRRKNRLATPKLEPLTALANAVLVYAEIHKQAKGSLLSWTAYRPSGEHFEAFVQPEGFEVAEEHLRQMRLTRDPFNGGSSWAAIQQRWNDFRRPNDVFVSWNKASLDRLEELSGGTPSPTVMLKSVYCNFRGGSCGHLSKVAAQEELERTELPFSGRAGQRQTDTLAVLNMLLEQCNQGY